MIILSLALAIAALGIAAFPCWRHSAKWGHAPSLAMGTLLFLLAAFTIGDRAMQSSPARIAAPKPRPDSVASLHPAAAIAGNVRSTASEPPAR